MWLARGFRRRVQCTIDLIQFSSSSSLGLWRGGEGWLVRAMMKVSWFLILKCWAGMLYALSPLIQVITNETRPYHIYLLITNGTLIVLLNFFFFCFSASGILWVSRRSLELEPSIETPESREQSVPSSRSLAGGWERLVSRFCFFFRWFQTGNQLQG